MNSIAPAFLRRLALLTIVVSALLIEAGCSRPPAVPIVEPEGAAADSSLATFEVSIVPREADPREVDLWISTSQPELWQSLPADVAADDWPQLVVVRTKEDFEKHPAGPPSGGQDPTSLRGEYSIVDGRLRFRLHEPLVGGGAYRVEFHRSAIPAFSHPGAARTLPIVVWHVVPDSPAPRAP
jgi:hypothetical protein